MQWHAALERKLNTVLEQQVPLAPLTTWKAGGNAETFLAPRNADEAYGAFAFCRREGVPVWMIGGGSNILVHPRGLPGLTLWMGRMDAFGFFPQKDGTFLLEADAGCSTRRLLHLCLANGYTGLEFATGIHGSIGGALMCNAGAGEDAVGQKVDWVETVEEDGTVRRWSSSELSFRYRFSSLQEGIRLITRCGLKLQKEDRQVVLERVQKFWSLRKGQPHGAKTAGCVFKNPGPGKEPAGLLLDRSGCKGMRVGDARVSFLHANFIENGGTASAGEIWELIQACRRKVYESSGIWLELEVNLLGGPWD
jgi:UDP-N-acetylmuramate dehydrogenase